MGKISNNKFYSKGYFFSFNYYYDDNFDNYSISTRALKYFVQVLQLVPEDSNIIKDIEKEIYNIFKHNLNN